jgi:acetyltransferase-like isoleucine patch superfamily enzyme
MILKHFAKKFGFKLVFLFIYIMYFISHRLYMKYYLRYLRWRGMKIHGTPRYISISCWFDGRDYSMIEIGHNAAISSNIRVLTHDYALTRAFVALGVDLKTDVANQLPVIIGENCFVGTNSILMPGCKIGKNVIVGAGSVVRGDIPDNAMIAGNPAQIIGNTLEWGREMQHLLSEGHFVSDPEWWSGRTPTEPERLEANIPKGTSANA